MGEEIGVPTGRHQGRTVAFPQGPCILALHPPRPPLKCRVIGNRDAALPASKTTRLHTFIFENPVKGNTTKVSRTHRWLKISFMGLRKSCCHF